MDIKMAWPILAKTYASWSDHDGPRLGAALAFYTILSLAPLMIIVIAIVALVFGRTGAQAQILDQVQGMMGSQGKNAVQTMLEHAQEPTSGIIASILGVATLLFGASGVFGELRSALDTIWEVPPSSDNGIWHFLRERFFSFAMVLAIGFLLLVSLMLSAGLAAVGKFSSTILPLPESVLHVVNFIVSFAVIALLFALIFKYVPEAKIPWSDVWTGAIATSFLFTLGKFLIGFYLGKAAVGSAYGAAGSIIVVIVWVYYSSMIFFFGAEFTHVLAQRDANQTTPALPHASH